MARETAARPYRAARGAQPSPQPLTTALINANRVGAAAGRLPRAPRRARALPTKPTNRTGDRNPEPGRVHRVFRTQRRIKGLSRVPQWSCFHPRIEAKLQSDMSQFKASRSFVIAEIVAMHYDEMRKPRTALAREVTEAIEQRITAPEPEEPRAETQRGRLTPTAARRVRLVARGRATSTGRDHRASA